MIKIWFDGLILIFLWLKRAIVFIAFVFCLLGSYFLIVYFNSEFCVRGIGFLFQLVGYLCSYVVIRQAEKYHDYPGALERLGSWFRAFPYLKKKIIKGTSNNVVAVAKAYAEGHRSFVSSPGDVTDRIKAVEDHILFIEGRITNIKKATD